MINSAAASAVNITSAITMPLIKMELSDTSLIKTGNGVNPTLETPFSAVT